MSAKFKFIKLADDENRFDRSDVVYEVRDVDYLGDLVSEFENFVKACGYILDGRNITIAENDRPNIDDVDDTSESCDDCCDCEHYYECYDVPEDDTIYQCECPTCTIERLEDSLVDYIACEDYDMAQIILDVLKKMSKSEK